MLFNNLGNAFREIGRLEASQAAFERALKLDPQLPEAH
jgi:tetratricopeptide (TPR) repeat protein